MANEGADNTVAVSRKLATVRRIGGIQMFSRNQSILTIDGWTVVVNTGNTTNGGYKVGEFVMFFELDAFLPAESKYSHLYKNTSLGQAIECRGEMGYPVKTTVAINGKKRQVRSLGLVYKLACFPEIQAKANKVIRANNSDLAAAADILRQSDFSQDLGIVKWDPEIEDGYGGHIIVYYQKLPPFMIKTSMERVQNCPNIFKKAKYRTMVFQESVKMDGCAISIYYIVKGSRFYPTLPNVRPTFLVRAQRPNGRLGVCSRKDDLMDVPGNVYWNTAMRTGALANLIRLENSIVVQGELVGYGINGNPLGYPVGQTDLFVYSMIRVDGPQLERADPATVEALAAELGFKHVPVKGYTTITSIAKSHEELIARADSEGRGVEGLVFKNCEDGRWFKVLSPRYLLDRDEIVRSVKAQEMEAKSESAKGSKPEKQKKPKKPSQAPKGGRVRTVASKAGASSRVSQAKTSGGVATAQKPKAVETPLPKEAVVPAPGNDKTAGAPGGKASAANLAAQSNPASPPAVEQVSAVAAATKVSPQSLRPSEIASPAMAIPPHIKEKLAKIKASKAQSAQSTTAQTSLPIPTNVANPSGNKVSPTANVSF